VNIRSLTRGDGVVIGAAVLLLIASFLDFYSIECTGDICDKADLPSAWDTQQLPLVLPSIFLTGLISAGLLLAARFRPEGFKVLGVSLTDWGTGLAVASAWSGLWGLFTTPEKASAGSGAILGLFATLALVAGAFLPARVAALKAPLLGTPRQQTPSPYGAGPNPGYGYPGQQIASPYGAHHGEPQYFGGQQQDQAGAVAQGPAAGFAPFWFAVPVTRPLYAEEGSPTPVAELAPGTWYLAVDQRGHALVAQTQDGRRGILQDTTGIQRG
jgi:hypothetical protein